MIEQLKVTFAQDSFHSSPLSVLLDRPHKACETPTELVVKEVVSEDLQMLIDFKMVEQVNGQRVCQVPFCRCPIGNDGKPLPGFYHRNKDGSGAY